MYKKIWNIISIRNHVAKRKVVWTLHCLNRLNQRDIKEAINNGKIIEYYYDDYPYPSCLILEYDANYKAIHIVCGLSDNLVYMITAYYPDESKLETNMKIRR